MKTLNKFFLTFSSILAFVSVQPALAQSETDTTMMVNGVCEMCKMTIEKAADIKGVSKAEWDVESKILTLVYDREVTSLEAISTSINESGYDTEFNTASDEAYKSLHKCCYYRDPEVVKTHQ
ncbi:MAG TPA: hypothetical protein DCG19_13655 [Cryomorphaceae bacterium]|nr:hypothetical protein [Owenweeksia sp.]MBF98402.1 hypothetical protein [Owenweeksia sp.]HAD98449.1 hypothetical protein [Cryomorphaceae bacterium]HBF20432.1 hypothetical protein [Cryomorphaceae bacterium]HCQ17528.1 hypothetical protein [Cryomorphaceae bacterium]|tara:strand:- start:360 stop:725 length:366 start_codon:yes stop_codon:yes gene_type:complete